MFPLFHHILPKVINILSKLLWNQFMANVLIIGCAMEEDVKPYVATDLLCTDVQLSPLYTNGGFRGVVRVIVSVTVLYTMSQLRGQ